MPGPTISEEDRPPTNPAIQVRFSTEADEYSFRECQNKCATPIYSNDFSSREKSEGAIYWKESGLYILPLT